MKKFHSNSIKALAFTASALAVVIAGPAFAQDADKQAEDQAKDEQGEPVDVTTDAEGRPAQQGAIVVTGSRIVRDTYSSISPLQVLTTENQQAVGAFDPSQILQRSEASAGQQIDATFNGFVLNNGPGSQTINLRGLGADRTLILVNGRRLAPAGVEGAPSNPSINLIPASLVDRYDILTDGASSVYGSDAVAGVVNVILRKDFDGLELQANGNVNPQGAGEDYTISGAWGFNTDRAVFGVGLEYQYRDLVRFRDRDFLTGCDAHREVDQNGNIRTLGIRDSALIRRNSGGAIRVSDSECKVGSLSGRIFIDQTRVGSVYYKPGAGNVIADFSENTGLNNREVDFNGDGIRDVDFQDYNNNSNNNPETLDTTFISKQELINGFAYGEYTFPGEANITPFFEAQFTRAEISAPNSGQPQIFPFVPDLNPFNPCNIGRNSNGTRINPAGVDCRAADNAFQRRLNPAVFNGATRPLSTGFSLPVQPIFAIRGDRNNFEVTQEQYRGVLGVRGDLPFIGSTWSFEVAGTYSRSKGISTRDGIREDRLALALGLDPTADYDGDGVSDNDGDGIADDYDNNLNVFGAFGDPQWIGVCNSAGLANPGQAAPDLTAGCVPVNLFTPSLLSQQVGDLSTSAERDYLFDQRRFDTTYEQVMLSAYVTGDLFELPAGPVGVVLGGEWREDTIQSDPNFQASNGLFFGFFADAGAAGSKWIRELYGEIEAPLMAGETLVEELTVKAAGRITDEEFYGTNGTFALGAGWRPVAPLLVKFNYGTSFRAPNLRENFLRGQSGFLTLSDPCAVPAAAFDPAVGYVASLETREPVILDNCRREGRDPTRVGIDSQGLNTLGTSSVEITSGGSLDIEPETSRSITTGFAFEEDWASGFEFSFNFNYYDIKLKQSIIEPSAQFIINDCYTRDDGTRSPFCDRITASSLDRRLVSDVFSGFLNLDQESVRGIDLNATFGYPVTIGQDEIDLQLNLTANHLIERSNTFTNDNGDIDTEDFAGEFGFPSWIGRATFSANWKDFTLTWQTRYIGAVAQDPIGVDPLSDAFGFGENNTATPGFFGDTCLGGGSRTGTTSNGVVPGDGILCQDVGFTGEYFEHAVSVRWDNGDLRVIAGVTNLFDRNPPLVDSSEVLAIANAAIGNGYNLDGREFFAQLLYRF
jgi:iron complex outermembrane receptor protein